ncbi:hypothetical protein D1007_22114 [Hordeum vulgare]|uniref:uncharacterized protein LOC123410254 isoform X1 n=1 Tax=Hordeum vulgare subsp. vulgare TaxID=112509 RepID=UPI001D1A3477|nr:uncharacterized protein LOC123410254 isoform X1 [Hordeum vulgare subsp. vulgare]KAE8802236.1 hypothetical protein D1007_22114 [Hordeum vulgare]
MPLLKRRRRGLKSKAYVKISFFKFNKHVKIALLERRRRGLKSKVFSAQDPQTSNRGKERHGKTIDEEGSRVSCNYCGKVVCTYNRLEQHVAGIRGNVRPCNLVPDSVRTSLRASLVDRKKGRMLRQTKRLKHEHDEVSHKSPALPSAQVQQPKLQPTVSSNNRCFLHYPPDLTQPKEITYNSCQLKPKVEASDYFDSPSAKSIGKFFFEAGPEPGVLHSSSLKEMVVFPHGPGAVIMPTYEAVLQEQLRETENRAKELKQEWQTSGCTVIVDSWKSKSGKSFVSVLVHCSKGMHFLRSIDVSEITEDLDELESMLSRVVDDVGAHNIVQIITNDVSPHMQIARQYVLNKYDEFFFVLCADHCINLLLEKIAALKHVSKVLIKARDITRFLYGHALPMKLKGRYVQEEILSSSYLNFVAAFITLERLISARVGLVQMFSSPEWVPSGWACLDLFERIQRIVKTDDTFWHAAAQVVKVTNPLVRVLSKLESDICPMGILYEAMDGAKEEIHVNIGDESELYWGMIDRIWDGYLHSPLHAAGHMLNPRIFYAAGFHADTEISSGIAACTIQLGKAHYNARKASAQLEVYEKKLGYFDTDPAMQQIMELPQVQWWSTHGARVPDLQTLARRVLSQTCFGATRYNMDWSLSEKLHAEWDEMTPPEQERLRQKEYVHYNRVLAGAAPLLHGSSVKQHDRVTIVLQDWIRPQK